jgi:hypothetical protein
MDWFEELFGFAEESPDFVRANLVAEGEWLQSRVTGRRLHAGRLHHQRLAEMRERPVRPGRLRLREVVGDVGALHTDPANAGAVFQVASQFNLLEMISPDVTPEQGITRYASDHTQGPACAMACAAGTVFRNHLVMVNGQRGQSTARQLDGLDALGTALGNEKGRLWQMRNGYALATLTGLDEIAGRIEAGEADRLRDLIRVGVQGDTDVTLPGADHRVSQIYCSAMPVAYSAHGADAWEPFARLALEAAYEATMLAALKAPGPLYLTLLGGGVFGNRMDWILDAIARALQLFAETDLDVRIVSYRRTRPELAGLLARFG